MSEIRKDELLGKQGAPDPLLYAACGLVWLNLGDLVHDTEDPFEIRSLEDRTPKLNEFHILSETHIELESGKHKADTNRLNTALWMASWIKYPKNGDSSFSTERRYSVKIIDVIEKEKAGKYFEKTRICTELLIGRRSVLMTQLKTNQDMANIEQTYDIPSEVSDRFRLMIAVPKVLRVIKPVLDEKREAKQKFRDNARSLQDIDPNLDLEFDNQGNAFYDGKLFVSIVDKVRQQADTSNDRKLTQIWGGQSLLSDRYYEATKITSLLMSLYA
jgi:hypothetical protein